jgi:hypothetical protein
MQRGDVDADASGELVYDCLGPYALVPDVDVRAAEA